MYNEVGVGLVECQPKGLLGSQVGLKKGAQALILDGEEQRDLHKCVECGLLQSQASRRHNHLSCLPLLSAFNHTHCNQWIEGNLTSAVLLQVLGQAKRSSLAASRCGASHISKARGICLQLFDSKA